MHQSPAKRVDITPLKRLAQARLRASSHLRVLLLSEPDVLPAGEFVVKVLVWLRLLDLETSPR